MKSRLPTQCAADLKKRVAVVRWLTEAWYCDLLLVQTLLPLDPVHAADTATTAEGAADGAVVGGGAETVPPDPVPDDDIPMSDYLWVSYSPRDGEPGSPLIIAFDEADPTRKGEVVQRCFPVDEVRNEIRSKRAKKNGYTDREWKRFIDRAVAAGKAAYEQAQLSGTVDSYEPPIFQPQGAGSGFPEGDTDVPCPVKNSGEAACLRDAWLCALPRLQDSYVKWAHRELPGIACLDELVTLASYTDKQTGLLYRLVPRSLTFERLARMRKGSFVVAGQSHAVAVVCSGGVPLIFNPVVRFAARLNQRNLQAHGILNMRTGISVAELVSTKYSY